ncbi:N-acetylmuramoyl-L-alanine amidase [Psychrobacter phenylpyruvicus]|uniref:N-acetylmuramoyl-L-alanine amidase n=1 Tax=Psychrobacter phenylpyruvicus TaxID=29432 RepID=A0A379LLL1_9GAMM|nr:N-acetylmuramoyl-L-alanine amidase [Psychrobacter phenylpyruvicus]SUD91476.1 N-acetylmuramoyl-L-alanine amidase AmiD precursor [Psychrobacter phenylpyruvicus]
MMKIKAVVGISLALSLLSGCAVHSAPHYVIDKSHQAQGKSQRIRFIVLHYTAENEAASLEILTKGNVSAHYLVPLANNQTIYQLVAENERAWHAGAGGFDGRQILNDTSIGIEIVNLGIAPEFRGQNAKMALEANNGYHPPHHYVDFTELQIQKVAHLVQDIAARYEIEPTNIIGHSDMAPSRKIDPGAKFPWEQLYRQYGVGAWYDESDKQQFMADGSFKSASIPEIKQLFSDYGYQINDSNEWDKPSRDVIYAFQLHFRPQKINGVMDLETYAILRALNKKYVGRSSYS